MKKSGLLAAAMMAAVVIGGCQTAEEKPVYNFSTRFPNASEAYGVQYGDTLYFISLYNSFYRVRNDSVSLLEEDFGGWSLTQLKNTLYYINGSSIYRREVLRKGSLGKPEDIYLLPDPVHAVWTDGTAMYDLISGGINRISFDGKSNYVWKGDYIPGASALVWDGKIYLNRKEAESYSLFSVDLATGEEQRVANGPAIAYGVLDGEVCIWDGTDDGAPVPLTTGANITYYYKRSRDGAQNMLDIYVKENDAYTLAASVPENSSLISPAAYQVGDSLLIRSFYPAEVDRNLTGEKPYGSAAYQYLLEPDGTLTLLLKEEIETPLS